MPTKTESKSTGNDTGDRDHHRRDRRHRDRDRGESTAMLTTARDALEDAKGVDIVALDVRQLTASPH